MPNLHIKGSLDEKKGVIAVVEFEAGCQTCFGTFDITIPYNDDSTAAVTLKVTSKSTLVNKKKHRDVNVKA